MGKLTVRLLPIRELQVGDEVVGPDEGSRYRVISRPWQEVGLGWIVAVQYPDGRQGYAHFEHGNRCVSVARPEPVG